MTTDEILHKYPLPKHLLVEFAYECAKDVEHLHNDDKAKYALSLVKRWLDGDATVTAQTLNDAAYAAAARAAYAAAAYAAARAAYYASYASYAAYAAHAATYAARVLGKDYKPLLLHMINTKLSAFERIILHIPTTVE
jgi:hypothetical protein